MNPSTLRSSGILLCVAALLAAPVATFAAPRIVIIIDDLGYQLAAGRRTANLPGPVVCAVLPDAPQARRIAESAFANGKEVLVHLPLQSMNRADPVEPGGIVLDMDRVQLARAFASSMASVPHAVGINTHQGSLITQHPGHMDWLMQEIRAAGNLIFVDSFTTHRSIALDIARENGVPAARRDVFLDPDRSPQTVQREFARLKALARARGLAIGIGHPYPATLTLLEEELPKLAGEGFELVGIGRAIARDAAPAALTGGAALSFDVASD